MEGKILCAHAAQNVLCALKRQACAPSAHAHLTCNKSTRLRKGRSSTVARTYRVMTCTWLYPFSVFVMLANIRTKTDSRSTTHVQDILQRWACCQLCLPCVAAVQTPVHPAVRECGYFPSRHSFVKKALESGNVMPCRQSIFGRQRFGYRPQRKPGLATNQCRHDALPFSR